jgi:hypothetical protein
VTTATAFRAKQEPRADRVLGVSATIANSRLVGAVALMERMGAQPTGRRTRRP